MENAAMWIINDDGDDRELISDILYDLKINHEVVFFSSGKEVIRQLEQEKSAPFIIMCDVNLPGMDGFEIREALLRIPDKKFHSVPFIFWSTAASETQIAKAYQLRAHGFFIKEGEYNEWKESFSNIIRYWSKSKTPAKKEQYEEPMM